VTVSPKHPPSAVLAAWREAVAKVRACWLVINGCPRRATLGTRAELLRYIAAADRRDPFAVPFVLEAIARRSTRCDGGELLASCLGEVSPHGLPLLHAGLGLGLAQLALAGAGEPEVAGRVAQFLDGVSRRALAEYAPIATEAFGLVLRSFHPRLVRPAFAALARTTGAPRSTPRTALVARSISVSPSCRPFWARRGRGSVAAGASRSIPSCAPRRRRVSRSRSSSSPIPRRTCSSVSCCATGTRSRRSESSNAR